MILAAEASRPGVHSLTWQARSFGPLPWSRTTGCPFKISGQWAVGARDFEKRKKRMKPILTAIALSVLFAQWASGGATIGTRLTKALSSTSSDQRQLIWVYLADKGTDVLRKTAEPSLLVSERSLQRRRNVLPADNLVDETDVPVDAGYIREIAATGAEVQLRSRWLNAASVLATPDQIARIASLPFVREVELIGRFRRRATEPAVRTILPPCPGTISML